MNITLLPLTGLIPVLLIAPLHAQGMGSPVLTTPGTATWSTEVTATGSRTIFTITGNTILDWGQFDLGSGSELVFDFVGGESVANLLSGTAPNSISGTVTSNGNVGFFSPNASLRVSGSITAENVTLATMSVDPVAFNSGSDLTLNSVSGSTLTVSGSVTATSGSVLLAGQTVRVRGAGNLQAAEAVRMAGGTQVKFSQGGLRRHLDVSRGDGFVLHMGSARAPRIEVAAGREVNINGKLDTGSPDNRIFLEVGQDGKVLREGAGLMVGQLSVKGEFDPVGIDGYTNDGDAAGVVSNSTTKIPALSRPDGSKANRSLTLVNQVPMSASADSGRDLKKPSREVAKRDPSSKSMFQASSLFGVRGSSAPVKR
jgi:hypothetical protein